MNTINPYSRTSGIGNSTSTGVTSKEGKPASNTGSTQADSVSLSGTAEQLARMQSRLDEVPSIDRERVEAIKAAIARGEYRVDTRRVAEQLIAMEKERLV